MQLDKGNPQEYLYKIEGREGENVVSRIPPEPEKMKIYIEENPCTCGYIKNILSIDPGWKNMGVIFIRVCECKKKLRIATSCIDLGIPMGSSVKLTIDALHEFFLNRFMRNNGKDQGIIDLFIIEKQPAVFKKNVELQLIIESFIHTTFDVEKSYIVSSVSMRNLYKLPNTGIHRLNKKENEEFLMSQGDSFIMGGYSGFDHNVVDAILYLNYVLQDTQKKLLKKIRHWPIEHTHWSLNV